MTAYISENTDKIILDALKQEGFEISLLTPFSALSCPVNTHADMLLCAVEDTIFVHRDYLCNVQGFKNVVKVDEEISNKYPNDVLLNIAIVGRNVFTNVNYASKAILKYLTNKGYTLHHVSQGYAHCSTCIVSDNAIITADSGIASQAEKANIDTLKIDCGSISLPPYEYGFIGGACGTYGDKIYFCGSLKYHPNGEKIIEFCQKHNKTVVELCDAPLCDVGGILFK